MAGLVFWGWVVSQANGGRIIPRIEGISRNCAITHFLVFYGWFQNSRGIGGCAIQHMLMYNNKCIKRLKVSWKSNLSPSWTQLVLISLCHVLWPCHSFKHCALLSFLPFQQHTLLLLLENIQNVSLALEPLLSVFTIHQHVDHPQCCVPVTAAHLQNFIIHPNRGSELIKQ